VKALDLLVNQHIIYSKPQSGFYVADSLIIPKQATEDMASLSSGNPKINLLGTQNLAHVLNIALDQYAHHHLDIPKNGVDSLKEVLPDYLAEHGIYANPPNIQMIQGTLQILNMFTNTEFPNNKQTILIEEPTYRFYIEYLKSIGKSVQTIKRDEYGLDLVELEDIFKTKEIKFFYIVPRNHNPLGTLLSFAQRKKIVELAIKYDVYLIEDDYLGDGHKLPKYATLHYLSAGQNVIYLRSYSKELPFIRFGICVIPDSMIETFAEIIEKSYFISYHMPALIAQATMEAYIKTSIYKTHVGNFSREIHKKLTLIKEIVQNWDETLLQVIGTHSGPYVSIRVSQEICIEKLIDSLAQKKIHVQSNCPSFYHEENFDNSIRLSIARADFTHLEESLQTIYETIQKQIKVKLS
jgi:DNA-binding transcriptional MocR family regulator